MNTSLTRKDYLTNENIAVLKNKSIELQLDLDRNSGEKEIIEAKGKIAVAKQLVLVAESAINFSLVAVVNAEENVSLAERDLALLEKAMIRLF